MSLKAELEAFLGASEARRVVLVGIGNPMRHDDVVGLKVLEYLEGKTSKNVLLLSTETVPESYTGVIRDFRPTHVLLLDAADFKGSPGDGKIIPLKSITNSSISTHNLPLPALIGYIQNTICPNIALIGIQVINIEYGEGFSLEVEKGAKKIANLIHNILIF